MKIVDYVSKYLKESYDESNGIETKEEASKAIQDLKDFFELGEDEENEFGDDLDKMMSSMDQGEELDDLDMDDLFDDGDEDDFYESKDGTSKKGCCDDAKADKCKFCPDCGTEVKGDDEESNDNLEEREGREPENDRNFPGRKYSFASSGEEDQDESNEYMRSRGILPSEDEEDEDEDSDEEDYQKVKEVFQNDKNSEMEKKLESYREGKKNKGKGTEEGIEMYSNHPSVKKEGIEMYANEPGAKASVGKGEKKKKRGFGKK